MIAAAPARGHHGAHPTPATGLEADVYARAVLSGELVAGWLVTLAAERHLRDRETGPARGLWFDEAAARRVLDFFGHLRLAEGEWAGRPFLLQPWQQFIVASLFGWKRHPDGYRRFRTSYVEAGKGPLALDTPVPTPTPNGWSTMGALRPGDRVFDEQGWSCTVTAVSPVFVGRSCYRVCLDDGEEIIADGEHRWPMGWCGRLGVGTTEGIRASLRYLNGSCVMLGERQIVDILPTDSVPVRCITVDAPSHLFLVGRAMVPTHNSGKSPLAAAIGLYGLVADGEASAEIYSAATTRDQARILFRDACLMVDASPALAARIEQHVANLAYPRGNSFFRPVSSEHRGLDGKRVHMALIDELQEHPSAVVVDKMRAGTKGRRQALVCAITNSGHDRHSVCWEHHEYSRQILQGSLDNDAWFAFVCTLDPCAEHRAAGHAQPVDGCAACDDWRDERTWLKANPNLGVSIRHDYLREQVTEALALPSKLNTVLRLNFCRWTLTSTRWLPLDKWELGSAVAVDAEALRGRRCFGGLDLAATTDLAAFALLFPAEEGDARGGYDVLVRFWCPEATVDARSRAGVPYAEWVRQGWITATEGDVIDYDVIREQIKADAECYDLVDVAYDRWNATQLVTQLTADGAAMVPLGQGFASLSAPAKDLEKLVVEGALRHGGNPVLRWMAGNVAKAEDAAGNIKPDREHSADKIDGIAALIMAIDRAMRHGQPRRSRWENEGEEVIVLS